MNKKLIKDEIRLNLREIKHRVKILSILIYRYFSNKEDRTQGNSYEEYDSFWYDFWEKKEYLRTEPYPFLNNHNLISDPAISPLEFKKEVIVKILSDKIKQYDMKSVLEVGSGAGLNMMFLAPMFPDVQFYGIEPTESGVQVSRKFLKEPPEEFGTDRKNIDNVTIIKASILNKEDLEELKDKSFDLVFTTAVMEQLNNYLDEAFGNIFDLNSKYYLFHEEWLEANSKIQCYKTLVESDYFRASTSILNKFPIEIVGFEIPMIQPSWLTYGVVFCKK